MTLQWGASLKGRFTGKGNMVKFIPGVLGLDLIRAMDDDGTIDTFVYRGVGGVASPVPNKLAALFRTRLMSVSSNNNLADYSKHWDDDGNPLTAYADRDDVMENVVIRMKHNTSGAFAVIQFPTTAAKKAAALPNAAAYKVLAHQCAQRFVLQSATGAVSPTTISVDGFTYSTDDASDPNDLALPLV